MRGSNSFENNFRPSNNFSSREETKGTKPLAKPLSIKGALLGMLIHGCRRLVLNNTNIRVAAYMCILFVSIIWDMTPFPKTYFSRSSNALNQYFVKLGWMWTLIWTTPFVILTSLTYCCGNLNLVKWHLSRIGVATVAWYFVTKSFVYYENAFGRCSAKGFIDKQACLRSGHFWHSFDISGHAFILIYSSLVMIEEARAIVGWESIEHLIREEIYNRSVQKRNLSSPLKHLTEGQLNYLKENYFKFLPYIKALFIGMTLLTCLWDLMTISTAVYFHKMPEKLIGGMFAILIWFFTYKYWYSKTKILPYAPGLGVFEYLPKTNKPEGLNRQSSLTGRGSFFSKRENGNIQSARLSNESEIVDPPKIERFNSRGGITTRGLARFPDPQAT